MKGSLHWKWLWFACILMMGAKVAYAKHFDDALNLTDSNAYLEYRASCEQKLADLRWSFQLWPKENLQAKPTRNPDTSKGQIRALVMQNIQQEVYLQQLQSWYFSDAVVRAEWRRIQASSQIPKR